jgi:hypothetical protein
VPALKGKQVEAARERQAELSWWCRTCQAFGLYETDGDPRAPRPCPACQPLPALEEMPEAAAAALAPMVSAWWQSQPHDRVILMTSPRFTLASEVEAMPLKSSAGEFAGIRKRVAATLPEPWAGKGKTVDAHERAHLWMQRLQDGWDHCDGLFGMESMSTPERIHCLLFSDGARLQAFMSASGGLYARGAVATMPVYSGTSIGSDDLAWSRTLHTLGLHWVDRAWGLREGEPRPDIPGWIFHGVAFHLELYYYGAARFDHSRDTEKSGPWGAAPRFAAGLAKDLGKDKLDLTGALAASVDGAGIDDKMIGWSLVDFLSAEDPGKLGALLQALAGGQELAAALQTTHGWTTQELERRWGEHVRRAGKQDRGHEPRRD